MEDKMELKGEKIILLVEEMFNDQEFWYPYYRLKEAGAKVWVVGSGSSQEYTGKSGTKATVDAPASDISASEFDGIIIPGGYAPDHMRRHSEMVNLVRDLYHLKGRTVTSFFAIKDDLVHAGAKWVDQEVVEDGKLITSRKPDDLPAFMRTVIGSLMKKN